MKYLREAGSKYFVAVVVVVVVLLLVDVFEAIFYVLHPLKTSENLYFLDPLRRFTCNGLSKEELNRQARDLQLPFLFVKHMNTRGAPLQLSLVRPLAHLAISKIIHVCANVCA